MEKGKKEVKTTAKERVEREAMELEGKLNKLKAFLQDQEKVSELREIDVSLLRSQSEAMESYLAILKARLSRWKDTSDNRLKEEGQEKYDDRV